MENLPLRLARVLSMLMDHMLTASILGPIMGIIMITSGIMSPNVQTSSIETVLFIGFFAMFFIYFNKDFILGRSIAKRIIGLKVLNNSTNEPASSLQCFIRNLTIPLWILEVIISLISPHRRLGDLIANTRVERCEYNPTDMAKGLKRDANEMTFGISLIFIPIIACLYAFGCKFLLVDVLFNAIK